MSTSFRQWGPHAGFILLLFFLSGVTALIYEVLWLKELGLLFGVTAYAAATTLAVFFLGLSVGSSFWGRRSAAMRRPLRVYAYLELGIAVSAALYFWLLDLYSFLLPPLSYGVGQRPGLLLLVKFGLSVGILFLPAFFMGGTLPVMGQYLIRRPDQLGTRASALYAINTLGAALGALAAGFYLPPRLGFANSYLLAIAANVAIFLLALWWSRGEASGQEISEAAARSPAPEASEGAALSWSLVRVLAFASGFLTLALEVLWTRMFAQVLQNSVYTFAAILTVFLLALALGSVVAHLLCRLDAPPAAALIALLTASGFLVGLTPFLFYRFTSGLEFLAPNVGWTGYVASVFGGTGLILMVPGILVGSVFPYLMKLSERWAARAGRIIGRLAAINTFAAILGSVAAGFVLLDRLGLWSSIRLVAASYLLLALAVLLLQKSARDLRMAWLPAAGLLLFGMVITYGDLALASADPSRDEELVAVREGAHGTVAVIRRGADLRLKVNNSYVLGTSSSTPNQRLQAWLPLSLHPRPRAVFFLGMGTGITAGGALDFPIEKMTVAELNPQVVSLARAHFGPYLNRLFEDPRVEVVVDDGRTFLAATRQQYDVIIGDIFLTYKAGVGSLYTREHFEAVRARLAPGGLFAQWLPMFDLSREEFGIIVRTLVEVFEEVTLWRRSFSPQYPVYALIARPQPQPFDERLMAANLERLQAAAGLPSGLWLLKLPLAAYAGNPGEAAALFDGHAPATDDRPVIEYLAPITNRANWGDRASTALAWGQLLGLCEDLLQAAAPEQDPFLAGVARSRLGQVTAGLARYRAMVLDGVGRAEQARVEMARFRALAEAASGAPAGHHRPGELPD